MPVLRMLLCITIGSIARKTHVGFAITTLVNPNT